MSEFDYSDICVDCPNRLIVQCKECKFGRKAYQLAGFVICTNRYSACHTSVIEDTFFCAKGELKVDEQE